MRPGQQNNPNKNRQRGRNNNGGRKHMNPLSRNYESNGPDVKVRGNAAHIAEKYVQLARDAHASGDSVMAENYLQHAEHYYRIVSAAQPQPRSDQFGQPIEPEENDDDFVGDEQADRFEITPFHQQQNERQLQNERQQQADRQHQGDRQFDRNRDDRNRDDRGQQGDRQQRPDQQQRSQEAQRAEQPRVEASAESGESQETLAAGEAAMETGLQAEADQQAEPRRTRERRPRRRRPQMAEGGPVDPDGPQPEVGDLPAFITAGGATNPAE
jgi:hypothetical protein